MKVIGAGFPKTGTKSLHVALDMLGYSVHDYSDALEKFEAEYEGFCDKGWTTSDFRRMYENIDSIVDGPGFFFWEELLEAFPEAKVIQMVRNDDITWYNSIKNQVTMSNGHYMLFYSLLSPSWRRFWRYMDNTAWMCFGREKFTGFVTGYSAPPNLIFRQAYRRHNAYVLNRCPKDSLLVFNCKNGWQPLCEFLGKLVPDEPFPTTNIGGQVVKLFWDLDILKQAKKEFRIGVGFIMLSFVGACFAAWKRLSCY